MAMQFALWIPLLVALTSLPRIVIGAVQGQAPVLTEEWRLWLYVVAPAVFAVIFMYVASLYAAWLAGPATLPRVARAALRLSRAELLPESGLAKHATTLSAASRVRLSIRTIAEGSILLFLAVPLPAILFGYLLRAGIYRSSEALIVGLCAVVEIGWLAFIAYRLVAQRARG
jgi:hypothetical protein